MARQKLFTKAVERELSKYPLYSQDGKGDNAKVVVKFFHPYSNRTWYITEGNKMEDGSWDLYGLTDNGQGELEYGYLSGRELEDYNRRYIAGIERDMYWKGNVGDARRENDPNYGRQAVSRAITPAAPSAQAFTNTRQAETANASTASRGGAKG